ncbi:hypothetical protein PLESTB_000691200 [Pleodorina starrii]|uniref:BTB domain-containing protein n=1 Tax=Pleodorina starrii TaxID=330485 RepID=A0A9W6F1J2_9CHLO|nr:hypothetical protein PLESTM_001226100 [Pleodorina starrii]GLC52947.1 hypothetical protein PLESTB_000691200 [Pleodorina starrii]GLC65242.1 hypothetical protein PLESTF_000267400 [Pleodorina starrii]
MFLEGRLRVKQLRGIVTRPTHGGHGFQTLVVGDQFRPLSGTTSHGSFQLEEPLKLYESAPCQAAEGGSGRRNYELSVAWEPAWDPYSASIFFREGCALLRLNGKGKVSVVAGARNRSGGDDGVGTVASFESVRGIVSDGAGVLYVADECRIRKVQLPASWKAGASSRGSKSEVIVSTILDTQRTLCGLAFDSCNGKTSLVYSSKNAVYRVPLTSAGAGVPALLAGQGQVSKVGQPNDHEEQTPFTEIWGMVMDGEGSLFLADVLYDRGGPCSYLRKLTPDGAVTTISKLSCVCFPASILPNGCLALCAVKSVGGSDEDLILVQLGLKPPAYMLPQAAPPRPAASGTLPGDLGALLDRQPDGTSDHTVEVGGRAFHVHRGILAARSEYFRRQFENEFSDSHTARSTLNEADPDAFGLVLRHLYTGSVEVPPAKAQAVAELASRLLLEKLRDQAVAAVLADARAETVVDGMLWADAQGFGGLLASLMAWYLDNQADVVQRAGDSFSRLEANPALMRELLVSCAMNAGKAAAAAAAAASGARRG